MFMGRVEDPTAFLAYLEGKVYERFHYGPFPQVDAPSVYYPIAKGADGTWVLQCSTLLEDGDVRWPLAGSVALADWGW